MGALGGERVVGLLSRGAQGGRAGVGRGRVVFCPQQRGEGCVGQGRGWKGLGDAGDMGGPWCGQLPGSRWGPLAPRGLCPRAVLHLPASRQASFVGRRGDPGFSRLLWEGGGGGTRSVCDLVSWSSGTF